MATIASRSAWIDNLRTAVVLLVVLTPLLRPPPGGPFVKMPLLTTLGLAASFALAGLVKRLHGLRQIL